jgi:hypothetical protein
MKKLLVIVAVLAVLPVATVSAATITYNWGVGQSVNISIAGVNGGVGYNQWAGSILASYQGSAYEVFCVDLYDETYLPWTATDVIARPASDYPDYPANPVNAIDNTGSQLAWIIQKYWNADPTKTAAEASYVQLAVWKVAFGDALTINNSTIDGIVSQMVSASVGQSYGGIWFDDTNTSPNAVMGRT